MFDFFSLMVAVVALIVAAETFKQIATLRARLDMLERSPAETRAAVAPPPPASQRRAELPDSSPEIAAERSMPAAETGAPMTGELNAAAENAGDASMPSPPPLPQSADTRSFEERIGTRWVVWVGGLTLALGGFFMVRYSIEAGLIGPGVRTLLGAAFALALLAAGEFLRRKEDAAAIDALPIANIPAILTAAGTSVAFATVYAAYALYGFLTPATAFILLGLVALGRFYHGPVLTTGAEQHTYSITWLAFGVILLAIGILVDSRRAWLASAVVIALTIVKAFVIDMSTLTGSTGRYRSCAWGSCWSRSAGSTSASCFAGSRNQPPLLRRHIANSGHD